MDEQLEFYFGEYNEKVILKIVEEEFLKHEELRKLDLKFCIFNGDEVHPFKSILICRETLNEAFLEDDEYDHNDLLYTVEKIVLTPDLMTMFGYCRGEKALKIIQEEAEKKAIKVRSRLCQ